MLSAHQLTGTLAQYEEPTWDPLLLLVGRELTGWFMWMHEIRLEDDAAVHAYKHICTRRYIQLAEDGRTFVYIPRGVYRQIPRDEAIDLAFVGWESLHDPDDHDVIRVELERAMDRA
jgi:hypothetical protein